MRGTSQKPKAMYAISNRTNAMSPMRRGRLRSRFSGILDTSAKAYPLGRRGGTETLGPEPSSAAQVRLLGARVGRLGSRHAQINRHHFHRMPPVRAQGAARGHATAAARGRALPVL